MDKKKLKKSKGFYYFAHPYTAKDKNGNFVPQAEEANFQLCCIRAANLIKWGYNIYAPICHTHPIHVASPTFLTRHEHEMWYYLDNEFIDRCNFDGIILAPEWQNSIGCVEELKKFTSEMRNRPQYVLYYEELSIDSM